MDFLRNIPTKAALKHLKAKKRIGRLLIIGYLLCTTPLAFADVVRWYTANQVTQGQQLFKTKCAKCHGEEAQGEPDWRKVDEDGEYPPPPLNGNAYAWHLSLAQLREQIQVGSNEQDGDMPSFRKKLSGDEIDAVIAYFQSKWSDITYIVWQSRQFPSTGKTAELAQSSRKHSDTHWLKQHLSAANIVPGEPMKTPVKGIQEVRVGDEYVYLSEDGNYAFTGQMINLRNGANLTRLNQAMETRELLQNYAADNMAVYPAHGKEKNRLTIFTDTSCNFCRKMHREVPELQAEGVTVRVIPYPRRGLDSRGYMELSTIWCTPDPATALSEYIDSRELPDDPASCARTTAVDAGYQLGNRVGISGTPFLVLQNGERIKGYKPAEEVMELMSIPLKVN